MLNSILGPYQKKKKKNPKKFFWLNFKTHPISFTTFHFSPLNLPLSFKSSKFQNTPIQTSDILSSTLAIKLPKLRCFALN